MYKTTSRFIQRHKGPRLGRVKGLTPRIIGSYVKLSTSKPKKRSRGRSRKLRPTKQPKRMYTQLYKRALVQQPGIMQQQANRTFCGTYVELSCKLRDGLYHLCYAVHPKTEPHRCGWCGCLLAERAASHSYRLQLRQLDAQGYKPEPPPAKRTPSQPKLRPERKNESSDTKERATTDSCDGRYLDGGSSSKAILGAPDDGKTMNAHHFIDTVRRGNQGGRQVTRRANPMKNQSVAAAAPLVFQSRYCSAGMSSKQTRAVCELFRQLLGARTLGTTTWEAVRKCGQVDGEELNDQQTGSVLNMLTILSQAHRLGYLSALCREEDGSLGRGFWNFIRRFRDPQADPDAEERLDWTARQTEFLYANRTPLQRLLDFVIGEISRES